MIYRKHPIRSLLTSKLRKANIRYPSNVYALLLKSIKGSNYKEFLKDKNVLLMYTTVLSAYKYAPNLESLLTQQYVCVMCTLWSDNTCVLTRFYSVKNANTQLIWSSAMQIQNFRKWCTMGYCSTSIYRYLKFDIEHNGIIFGKWIS